MADLVVESEIWVASAMEEVRVSVKGAVLDGSKTTFPEEQEDEEKEKETGYA